MFTHAYMLRIHVKSGKKYPLPGHDDPLRDQISRNFR